MYQGKRYDLTFGGRVLSLCLLVVAVGGCQTTNREEAEHHTPAHKPADFPAAVDRLLALHDEIARNGTRAADQLDVFTESFDIARWLPELAADSDMEELPWNRVHEIASQMEKILGDVLSREDGQRRGAYRQFEMELERHRRGLAEVKQQLKPAPAAW
jgi:hypothetical protein